jgi:hypothetical protein
MSGLGTKLRAWFIHPPAEKRGGQVAPPNAPVLKTSREIPLPPVPHSRQPVTFTMNVNLSGPEFERAVERALEQIIERRGAGWLLRSQ